MKKTGFFLLFFFIVFAQKNFAQDSSRLRISLLTCGAGQDELYATWGHTAIRVIDSVHMTDVVYNYGTFDFNDPDFYSKFTRGKLDYMLSASSFPEFMYEYQVEKRSVIEQVLNIPDTAKRAIRSTLTATLGSAARYYKYDFAYNNCTSRVRDLFQKYAGLSPIHALVPEGTTIRNMLHEFLDKTSSPWSKLGIDLVLGSPTDKKVDINVSMFLPDYLMKGLDSSAPGANGPLVLEKTMIHPGAINTEPNRNWPLYDFCGAALLIMAIAASRNKAARIFTRIFDITIFLVTGLLGCFLLFMWFGTDHKACGGNYNLLWAIPFNLVAVFALRSRPDWLRGYFSICFVIHLLTLVTWVWLPQQLNTALIPVVVLLLHRCWQLRKPAVNR